jgi:alpha-D-ribose 1-methylphosphonate 5-triphosphate synthase subunit PhnH
MCTLTHFAYPLVPDSEIAPISHPVRFHRHEPLSDVPARPRFQVVMAGIAFFHIKEISTGCVRGFRANHNEACALARYLESHS